MCALWRILPPSKRAVCRLAALGYLRRISALEVPGVPPERSLKATDGHFDVNVDAVEQRAADLAHVPFDLRRRAVAGAARVAAIAAGARIQRGDEHEVGRKRRAVERAGDRHRAVFERLAQHFERLAVELGQLVEEEHAVVGERDLARRGRRAAADQAGVADRVMRRAERADGQQRLARLQAADRTVDARGFDRFGTAAGRAGSSASAWRASSCPSRAGRASAGCARRPRRPSSARLAISWPRTSAKSTS